MGNWLQWSSSAKKESIYALYHRNINARISLDEVVYESGTGRPDYPVSQNRVAILRQRFAREYNVMKLLTRPYVSAEAESDYFASKNVSGLEQMREEEKARAEASRMPGKVGLYFSVISTTVARKVFAGMVSAFSVLPRIRI
ncbi:hypothetical protein TELCIR_07274 [Teladorsagia circumcincta]|uniref:Uncharacterized protein n=1 Tax=Teladorsagia circumcincta TaxID=45464 RepID=A0A2G9UKQ0_TELCI|nr:hypothetical protein TELCIR_07274 [Teladorsagia circumcincta]